MWNDTDRCGCALSTLPELFAAQAARTPDAIALVFEDRRLSYAELEAHANRLAHHLRGLGVGPETVVGLCVERSPEMVIGLLGILKAGGAYLPLDPGYPRERLAFMLRDAGAPVLVTQSGLLSGCPGADGELTKARTEVAGRSAPVRIVRLDADWPRSRGSRPARPRSRSTRATPPMSSTPRAQPEPQKASSSSTPAWPTKF